MGLLFAWYPVKECELAIPISAFPSDSNIGKVPVPLQLLKGHITISEIGTETCRREDIVITARICHISSEGSAAVLPPFQYVIMYVNPF